MPLSRRNFLALSAMAVAQTALRPALVHRKTVVIVDDHQIVRVGLRRFLETEPDLKVIGEGSDGAEAVQLARQLKPDILLLNLAMPKQTGLEALRELNIPANATLVRVIMLTACDDKNSISIALKLGARGYVVKSDAVPGFVSHPPTIEWPHENGTLWFPSDACTNSRKQLRSAQFPKN